MIAGIHTVRKLRGTKEPVWYVYAHRGGPQIHRHIGWAPPKLSVGNLRKLVEAADRQVEHRPGPETLGSIIKLWRPDSPEWKNLGHNTKKTWSSALGKIELKWGATPLTVWSDPRMASKVFDWRDSRASTPRAADMGVSVLRALLKFARLRGKVALNVADGIPQLYQNGSRAAILWTDDDVLVFHKSSKELKMDHLFDGLRLAALTGLRRADLVSLTWDEVEDSAIVKLAAKVSRGRRQHATMPRIPALDALLAELKLRKRADGVNTVLVNSFGKPWTGDGFGTSFNRVRDHARIVHVDQDTGVSKKKHVHDLRGTFCTKLILAGLSNEEAAEIMGWSPQQVRGIRRSYVDQRHVSVAIGERLRGSL